MKYIKEKAPSVKSKVKQINQKISKLVSKKEDAVNKAKEMADSEEPSGKMQASLAKIQLRQSESEAEKLMLQKQAEILKAKIDTAKKKEKTVDDIEEMENKTITIQEGVMSDIHQMIGNHKSFSSFEKEFFKEYGHKKVMKRTPEFLEWLEALYNDSQFVVDEADAKPGPDPYMRGLDDDEEEDKEDKMKKQAEMDDDDPDAYKELPGDKEAKEKGEVKTSKHVKKYHELYGDKKDESVVNEEKAEGDRGKIADAKIETALKTKSEETGVPIGLIRIVMRRGMAAWKTGHRPGASEQQWGYARVNAFLTKGEGTWGGADKDVAKEVRDGGHDKGLKERIESDIRLSDKVVAFKTDDSGFEGQSPNTITCNNCTWTWMKQDGGDDMYVCHKCGTNNAPMLGESILNEEDSYNDYPAAAKKNAKKALDWRDEHGRDEVDAGTAVGWTRANQLAKGEKISADTVKRMASFNRHRKNSSIKPELKATPWKDKGYVSWLIWGGDEGVDWAMKKSKEIDDMKNESKQMKYIRPLNEAKIKVTKDEWPYLEFKVGSKKHKVEFDYEDIIDDHGNEGQDQYWIGKDDEGQEWMIDVYADYRGEVEEVHYDTIVKESVSSEFSPMGYAKRVVSGAIKIKDAMKEAGISLANMAKLIKRIDKSFDVDAAFLEKNVMQDDPEKFNESVVNEALASGSKIEKNLNKALKANINMFGDNDETIKVLDTPVRIERSQYDKEMNGRSKNFGASIMYMYGSRTNEYNTAAVIGVISRTKGTAKVFLYSEETYNQFAKGASFKEYEGASVLEEFQNKTRDIVSHLSKFPADGSANESVTEGIYAKESKIVPGEYIKTQYGYFYKRVEGKVGGQDAYVEIKKGKEGKRKTSIHDTVDFDIVDKSVALGESVSLKYIKPLNEGYWSSYDYDKWVKDNGRPKYPKWIKSTLKELVKGGFMEPVYDAEHNYMILWLASLENKKRSEAYAYDKKGEKEFGKVGYAMYKRFYNDLTGYNMFFMQGAMAALEVSKHIQDRVANGEPVEPAYYMMKEYFNNIGMDTKRSRVFNAAYEKLEKWMKDNSIPTL